MITKLVVLGLRCTRDLCHASRKKEYQRILQRYAAADYLLSELEKGHFRNLARFLGNTRFNLRQITDSEAFREEGQQRDSEKLIAASRLSGVVHVSMQPVPSLSLFYEKEVSEAEVSLLSSSKGSGHGLRSSGSRYVWIG